jgi:6-pyruvoyl-tetrahydropterin synthase
MSLIFNPELTYFVYTDSSYCTTSDTSLNNPPIYIQGNYTKNNLYYIFIGEKVTYIDSSYCSNCSNVTNIIISKYSSLNSVGNDVFTNNGITSLLIDPSNVLIMYYYNYNPSTDSSGIFNTLNSSLPIDSSGNPIWTIEYTTEVFSTTDTFNIYQGSIDIEFNNTLGIVFHRFTPVSGELELSKLLSNEYVEETVVAIFNEIKTQKFKYTRNMSKNLLNSLSAFFSAITYEKSLLKNIETYTKEYISNQIQNSTYIEDINTSAKRLADEYPSIYFSIYNAVNESIQKHIVILNNE